MISVFRANAEIKELISDVFNMATTLLKAKDVDIDLTFVGKSTIRTLNREQRNVDRVTDVLSFPTLENIVLPLNVDKYPYDIDPDTGRVNIGSIVICRSRAAEQAVEYGHSLKREIAFLTVHGILHLLGYDHIEEADAVKMRAEEKRILNALGITREIK